MDISTSYDCLKKSDFKKAWLLQVVPSLDHIF